MGKNSRTAWDFPFHSSLWKGLFSMKCSFRYFSFEQGPFQLSGIPFLHSPSAEDNWGSCCLYSIHPACQKSSCSGCSASSNAWEGCSQSHHFSARFRWTTYHAKPLHLLWAHTLYICKSKEIKSDPFLSWSALHFCMSGYHLAHWCCTWYFISCAKIKTTPARDFWNGNAGFAVNKNMPPIPSLSLLGFTTDGEVREREWGYKYRLLLWEPEVGFL